MKKPLIILFWLIISLTASAQFTFEEAINGERFGHLQINMPFMLDVGPDGKTCIADYYNGRLVILNADGSLYKTINGQDLGLSYFYPVGVDIDNAGNIIITESAEYKVMIFDPQGNLQRTFGGYGAGTGTFFFPWGITTDVQRNIYVSDFYNKLIQVFDASGNFLHQFPLQGIHPTIYASGIDVDLNGYIYAALYSQNEVQIYSPAGILLTTVSMPMLTHSPYSNLIDIVVNNSFDFFVIDRESDRLVKVVTPGSDPYYTSGGSAVVLKQSMETVLDYSNGIALANSGELYQSYSLANTIHVVHPNTGETLYSFPPVGDGQFSYPADLTFGAPGYLYVADCRNHRIQAFDAHGNYQYKFGSKGSGNGQLYYPRSIASDNMYLYVQDESARISRFDYAGNFVDSQAGPGVSIQGVGGIAVDNNFIYAAWHNEPVYVYDKNWVLQRTIGSNTMFTEVKDIVVDTDGTVYVASITGVHVFNSAGTHVTSFGSRTENITITPEHELMIADGNQVSRTTTTGTVLEIIGSVFNNTTGLAFNNDRLYISESAMQRVNIYTRLPPAEINVRNMTLMYGMADFSIGATSNVPGSITYALGFRQHATVSPDGLFHIIDAGDDILITTQPGTAVSRKTIWHWPVHIDKRPLPVMIDSKIREYGDENPELTFRIDPVFFQFDDDLSDLDQPPVLSVDVNNATPVGSYPINVNGAVDNCYSFSLSEANFIIQPAPLAIQADVKFKTYKTENPELTFQYSSFKNGENLSVLTQLPTIHTDATLESPAGQYAIVVEGGVAANYSIVHANSILEILKADQQVVIDPVSSPVPSTEDFVSLSATATSGLPVLFTVTSGPGGAVGNEIMLTGEAGTVTVTALQAGNENYNSASAEVSFDVVLIMGVDENLDRMKVYPNPVQNELIVQGIEVGQVNLIDSKGSFISLGSELFNQGYLINTRGVPDGLYVLRVTSVSGQAAYRKLLIKH